MDRAATRREIECRPLLIAAIGLIIGLTARDHLWNLVLLAPVLWFLSNLKARSVVVIAFAFGVLLAPTAQPTLEHPTRFVGECRVESYPSKFGSLTYSDVDCNGSRIRLQSGPTPLEFGETIGVSGRLSPLDPLKDERLIGRGFVGRLSSSQVVRVNEAPLIYLLSNRLRSNLLDFLHAELPPDAAALVAGMCLSANDTLTSEARRELRETGTVHLVSSSGLHVLVMAGMLTWLLAKLPIPRHWQLAIVTFLLVGYFVASGFHPATLRAVTMAVVGMFAYRFRRSYDVISALSLAMLIDLFWRPTDIYEAGFQLSFVTVAAFAIYGSKPEAKPARRAIHATVLSTLATAPLIAQRLGIVSLGSVLANLLTVFTLPFAIGGTYGSFFFSALSRPFGSSLLSPVALCAGWFSAVLSWLGSDGFVLSVPAFSGYWVLLTYVCLAIVWRPRIVHP